MVSQSDIQMPGTSNLRNEIAVHGEKGCPEFSTGHNGFFGHVAQTVTWLLDSVLPSSMVTACGLALEACLCPATRGRRWAAFAGRPLSPLTT